MTVTNTVDFTQAYKEAGISAKDAKNYTWHHVADFDPTTGKAIMQLVKTQTHINAFPQRN